ncbi:MAG: helix-hairpin-helix domain-containing protein [Hydrogenophilaceae bacterium]|nr:helix-hairpin-helix domain-containing protein [Hydrogenophilaceae bacterium]
MKKLVKILVAMMFAGSAWAAVDINTATQSELESVKGLGPSKAKAIIAYREKNGNFKSIEELDNVKGFGKSSIAKLRDELTVGSSRSSAKQENPGTKK